MAEAAKVWGGGAYIHFTVVKYLPQILLLLLEHMFNC